MGSPGAEQDYETWMKNKEAALKSDEAYQAAENDSQNEYKMRLAKQAASKAAIASGKDAQAAASKLAGSFDPYLDTIKEDIKGTPSRTAAAGAAALAPVAGQFGMGASATSPASALVGSQVSQEAQRAAAAQMRKLQEDYQSGKISQIEAEQQAANIGIQVQQMIMDQPDPEDYRAKADARYAQQWSDAVEGAKGFWNDDEEALLRNVRQFMEHEQDPVLKDKWLRRACGALKDRGQEGGDWCEAQGYATGLEDI